MTWSGTQLPLRSLDLIRKAPAQIIPVGNTLAVGCSARHRSKSFLVDAGGGQSFTLLRHCSQLSPSDSLHFLLPCSFTMAVIPLLLPTESIRCVWERASKAVFEPQL